MKVRGELSLVITSRFLADFAQSNLGYWYNKISLSSMTLTVLLGNVYHSSKPAKITDFSHNDWKASHQCESNQTACNSDFERLKLRDLTKPHYRLQAGGILRDYSVWTWKLKGQSLIYCIFPLRITPISLLSSSVMLSGLKYNRSVVCVSRCPLVKVSCFSGQHIKTNCTNLHSKRFDYDGDVFT